jgi:hypothetical protein
MLRDPIERRAIAREHASMLLDDSGNLAENGAAFRDGAEAGDRRDAGC